MPTDSGSKSSDSLRKELRLLDIYALATGATLSAGLFLLPGLAATDAGPAIVLAYVLAALPLLPALGPTPVGFAGPREAPAERAALAAYDDLARHLMEFLARGRPAPPAVEFDGAAFVVGHANRTTRLAPLDLYRRCRCALCVDENSGRARSRLHS